MNRLYFSVARLLLAGLSLGSFVACDGCKDEPPPKRAERPPVVVDAGAPDVEPVHPLMKLRLAYGLPVPPEVVAVRKGDGYIVVQTALDLDEVEGFFRSRLVDYEFFRPHKTTVEIVGLRGYMPRINAQAWGRKGPVSVRYIEAAEPEPVDELAEEDHADVGHAQVETTKKSRTKRTKGTPVEIRTKDGELLAPGARWGEPYTPPYGSPLHQERHRPNFGRPFGEWILN